MTIRSRDKKETAYLGPYNRQKTCRYGSLLYNPNDTIVGRALDLYGEYAEAESMLFRQIIKKGNVIVEAGAHIGAQTLLLARLAQAEGAVVAFEPQRLMFQTLCANMALNNIENVFCRHGAVGEQAGVLSVPKLDPRAVQNFGALRLGGHEKGERVPVVPIDSLALKGCDFIKIKVPGMEKEAVLGAKETIARYQPLLYVAKETVGAESAGQTLPGLIASLGYHLYWHRSPHFSPQNYAGNSDNHFSNEFAVNMLCIPDSSTLRVSNLPAVDVKSRG